jgi:hypothetical protein
VGDELHAVADREDRNHGLTQPRRAARCPLVVDTRGPTRENDALQVRLKQTLGGDVVGQDFAVNVRLADATRDELGVLGPEIEDGYALLSLRP